MKSNSLGESHGIRITAEQLFPRDAVFVYDELGSHAANVIGVYVFDLLAGGTAAPLPEHVCGWLRARLGCSAVFHRRLERVPWDLDLPYWVPDARLRIRDHVKVDDSESCDWPGVRNRIAAIAAARMDLSRPPWELHVFARVTGFPGYPAVSVVVLKLHHSAADGIVTRRLESKLFGGGDAVLPPDPDVGVTAWSGSAALVRAVSLLPYRTALFLAGLFRTRRAARAVAARVASGRLHEPVAHRPATRFNRAVHADLVFDLVAFPMRAVLELKAAMVERTTVNDLMLTVVSGALATYLAERGESPSASLAANVPISMRGIAQWDSATQLCLMSVDLHTDITDPMARLRAIRVSARREKNRWADDAVMRCEMRLHTAPAWLLRLTGWARTKQVRDGSDTVRLVNTTISNVPPVSERLAFLGAPVVAAFGVLPAVDGDGLRHLISSQGDQLWISFSADSEMLPDPGHYADLLRQAFYQLAEAARSRQV